jgi:hypothetical protein
VPRGGLGVLGARAGDAVVSVDIAVLCGCVFRATVLMGWGECWGGGSWEKERDVVR